MSVTILFHDDNIIAVVKPPLLPTQPDKTGDESLKEQVATLIGRKVHVVHRLDRVASGVVLFAKNAAAAHALTELFKSGAIRKIYRLVVENRPPAEPVPMQSVGGVLVHYMAQNSAAHKSLVRDTPFEGSKRVELAYQLRGYTERYSLIEVILKTGHFHQIRAQMAHIGCPIKGDVKYGARRKNANRAIYLHAWQVAFTHPITREALTLTAPLPPDILWDLFED